MYRSQIILTRVRIFGTRVRIIRTRVKIYASVGTDDRKALFRIINEENRYKGRIIP